jgi:hypothetical protein
VTSVSLNKPEPTYWPHTTGKKIPLSDTEEWAKKTNKHEFISKTPGQIEARK